MMRKAGSELFEKEMTQCDNMKALRRITEKIKVKVDFNLVELVKVLLPHKFQRLQLKEKTFLA